MSPDSLTFLCPHPLPYDGIFDQLHGHCPLPCPLTLDSSTWHVFSNGVLADPNLPKAEMHLSDQAYPLISQPLL